MAGDRAAPRGDGSCRPFACSAARRLPRVRLRAVDRSLASCRASCMRPTARAWRGTTAGLPARTRRSRSPRATHFPSTRATSSARRRSSGSSPPAGRSSTASSPPPTRLRREVNGDTVTYVVTQERQLHERLLLPVRLLRVLEGPAGGEPAREAVPRPARRDRSPGARGVGPRRRRDLPAGRHPPGLHGRDLPRDLPGAEGGAARPAHPRVLGARGLAGRGDARARPRGLPRRPSRRGAGVTAGDSRRDPRRRGPPGHLPGQGHDRHSGSASTTRRTASACARRRRSCSAMSTARGTGRGT